ncbi:hypothetical protein QYF61_005631 [Mycteria americana]|uniref:Reverse transcriptase/retrotransposon-derived protein RNase H-like domain-containing protein n=1 Tax=Mycteria americana TaxID=33587 RepID=A0AAN7MI17_MYCAM|nr:hypothetical protein QYF61_005631 [Mycteria americana]
MPSSYTGAESICISGVTGGYKQLTVEAEVSLTGNEWQKHPIVTGPEAPCILGLDYLRRGYFKDPKGYRPIWPVRKSNGEWRLTVDYRGLDEVTLPLSAAMPDMLELQYELESKAAKMHIPNYSLIVSPLYQVTRKKNNFKWGPEQRQAFDQTKWETVHAVALGPVRAGQDVKNVLDTAARENGPTWIIWQKEPGETRGQPLGYWSWGYRGSEARYTPTEKEILAAYEGVRAASEVVGTEAQLLFAP